MKRQLSWGLASTMGLGMIVVVLLALFLFLAFPAHSAGELSVEGVYTLNCRLKSVTDEGVSADKLVGVKLSIDGQTNEVLATCSIELIGAGTVDLTGVVSDGVGRINFIHFIGKDSSPVVNMVILGRVHYAGTPSVGSRITGQIYGWQTAAGVTSRFWGSFRAVWSEANPE